MRKLTLDEYTKILFAAQEYRKQHPNLREGQALWTVVYEKYPELAVRVSASEELNPFFDDSKIEAFCTFIYENGG